MVYKLRLLLGLTTPPPGYSHPDYGFVSTGVLKISELLPKDIPINVSYTSYFYVASKKKWFSD